MDDRNDKECSRPQKKRGSESFHPAPRRGILKSAGAFLFGVLLPAACMPVVFGSLDAVLAFRHALYSADATTSLIGFKDILDLIDNLGSGAAGLAAIWAIFLWKRQIHYQRNLDFTSRHIDQLGQYTSELKELRSKIVEHAYALNELLSSIEDNTPTSQHSYSARLYETDQKQDEISPIEIAFRDKNYALSFKAHAEKVDLFTVQLMHRKLAICETLSDASRLIHSNNGPEELIGDLLDLLESACGSIQEHNRKFHELFRYGSPHKDLHDGQPELYAYIRSFLQNSSKAENSLKRLQLRHMSQVYAQR